MHLEVVPSIRNDGIKPQANGRTGSLARVRGFILSSGLSNSCGPNGPTDEGRQERGGRQIELRAGTEGIVGCLGRKLAQRCVDSFMRQLTEGQCFLSQRGGRT